MSYMFDMPTIHVNEIIMTTKNRQLVSGNRHAMDIVGCFVIEPSSHLNESLDLNINSLTPSPKTFFFEN